MEAIATDLGKTFSERLINGAIEKSRYIFCFKCIVEDFEVEKIKLEAERTTMRQRFRVATEKDKDIQFNAQFWEKQVDKLIQEDTKIKKRCFFGIFPDCIWRYRRGEELATKIDEIKKWMEKAEKLENVELARHRPDVERYSSQYFISFKSRELIHKELLEALKDESSYITGLYGMGGTGKTTLAREVGKEIKELEKFDHVIDTTVSFTPDIKKIQDDIAGSLGLQWGDINESDRPKTLWSRLTNGEKILVILDDVWGSLNFHDIGIPNIDNHKGCKVLLITRNLQVCNKMVPGKKIHMDLVTEKEAWVMFKMFADLNNISSKNILNKGREIATECKRLPVAIATIASSLKGHTRLEEWDAVLNFLHMPVAMHDVDDDSIDIYKCLKFSYDYLKNEKTKKLFLLCSLFLEDEEISIEILTKFAIGAGLFGEDYGSYKNARSQVVKAKNKLLESCLLLETKKGDVQMHDLVREVAQWIANKEIQIVNFSNKTQKSMVQRDKRIKYLSCEGHLKDLFSSKFYGSKLEILIVNMDMQGIVDFPFSFFESMSELRVLSLTNRSYSLLVMERQTLALPQSMVSLTNIRSLLVERVGLGDISIFGSLKSLETLDLAYCEIDKLPHEITKLEKLRLLHLYTCTIRRNNPFQVIQKCPSLEELYFSNSFNEFCVEITLPTSLQRYHVTDNFGMMNNSLSKLVSVQEVHLSEAACKDVMQTAELLQLVGIGKGWRNLMPENVPIDQGMNELIEFSLKYVSQLQFLVETEHIDSQEPTVFSNLVVLELMGMDNMQELCNGTISSDSFNNLEELSIKQCPRLRSLFKCSLNLGYLKTMTLTSCSMLVSIFDMSTSRSLVLLEKLEIIDCEQLENIFTYERRGNDTIEEILVDDNKKISGNSMFPNLKIVNIKRCSRLQFILPDQGMNDLIEFSVKYVSQLQLLVETEHIDSQQPTIFSNLVVLELVGVENMEELCNGTISSDSFNNLEELSIKQCPRLRSLFKCSLNLGYLKTMTLTSCSTLVSIFDMSTSRSLVLLEKLEIIDCEQLENIFTYERRGNDTIEKILVDDNKISGNSMFPNLKVVNIKRCSRLQFILLSVDKNIFLLEAITIEDCSELKYIFGQYQDVELASLKELTLVNLPNFINIFPESSHSIKGSSNSISKPQTQLEVEPIKSNRFSWSHMCCYGYKLRGNTSTKISLLSEDQPQDRSISKDLSGNYLEPNLAFDEINGQQKNLGLQKIELSFVTVSVTYLFVGLRNCFALQNLLSINISQCEKLEIIFSTCVLKCLPQLVHLKILGCDELKYIIEDDENNEISNDMSTIRTCFPKLETLAVIKCNKLKYIFPASICSELPELRFLVITEADKLEKIFGGSEENDQRVEIPNLKAVAFVALPSLCEVQKNQFQTVEHRLIWNRQKLSFPVESTDFFDFTFFKIDMDVYRYLQNLLYTSGGNLNGTDQVESSTSGYESNDPPGEEGTTLTNVQTITSSTHLELASSSQELMMNDPPIIFFGPKQKGEERTTLTNVKTITSSTHLELVSSSQEQDVDVRDSDYESMEFEIDSDLEIPSVALFPRNSKELMMNDPPIIFFGPEQKGEEGTTLTNFKTITSSTHLELVSSSQEQDVDVRDSQETTKTNIDQVSFMKVSSIIKEQFPKDDDDFRDLESKPTHSNHIYFPSMPSEGNPSQIMKNSSSSSGINVIWELEQLVSENYLDYENLSLLTDFLVKYPSVLLRDSSLSNRYKGYAYICLAELLQFLLTHSVLDVLGSNRSKFVKLLQDVRSFAFDKDWLDSVERRALFPDIQVSQDALQKLLESKQQVSKEVEVLRLKIDIFNQHVEDLKLQLTSSEAVLESIIQQEAHVLETKVALSAPLGY